MNYLGENSIKELIRIIKTAMGQINPLPPVTISDDGKFLRVVDGEWTAASIPNAEEVSF